MFHVDMCKAPDVDLVFRYTTGLRTSWKTECG